MSNVQPDIPATTTYTRYVTKAGDSASSIAKQNRIDWTETWNALNNENFRNEMGKRLATQPGMMAVIRDINFTSIPAGLVIWLPTGHTNLVTLPAAGRPYTPTLAFRRETLGSTILTPAQTGTGKFELRITMPIFLKRMTSTGGLATIAGTSVSVKDWTDVEFERFKLDVKSKAEKFWNKRFRLGAPPNYPYFRWPTPQGAQTGVDCTMEIVWASVQSPNSLTVSAYKRNLISAHIGIQQYDRMDSSTWTDSILTDPNDIHTPDDKGTDITSQSNTVAHEVGHLLLLGHSGGDGDQPRDYGLGQEKWKILNIMGFGDQVDQINSVPWLRHIYWHTGVVPNSWTVSLLNADGTVVSP